VASVLSSQIELPQRVTVGKLLSGRYSPGKRPVSWDERKEGRETIETIDGRVLHLASNGGQSTPDRNWELLLTRISQDSGESSEPAFIWTLYGIASEEAS